MRFISSARLGLAILVLAIGSLQARSDEPASPLSPDDERLTFQLADEQLTIELVACEPNVVDPVACAWDEAGKLYVAEMRDYPIGPPGGTIRVLEDVDGDGLYEQATLFAEGIPFPNSVLPWRGGVFVTAAPDVLYLKDTDGDGRADQRRVVLSGLAEGNQQLRANGLLWGLDGWIYVANGRSEGVLKRPDEPNAPAISIRRHDFRFQPESGKVEAIAGFSQFGLARDDWGNRFLSWNTNPVRHVVIEESELARHPQLLASETVAQLIDHTQPNRIYPISRPPQTFNRESVQHFNASCGLTIFRGDLLPSEYYGNALVCESLTNLVHRRVLRPHGSTFVAERAENEREREFLAASDSWFRPVNLTTGPDGALYVIDFYRKWVEHPQFVAPELREGVDFRNGDDRGRIWRVRARDSARPKFESLAKAGPARLVDLLYSTNGWQRDTAQRLMIEQRIPETTKLLREDPRLNDAAANPAGRVAALWTLCQLNPNERVPLPKDRDPHVRAAIYELMGKRQGSSTVLLGASRDPDARARLKGALALGNLQDLRSTREMIAIAARDDADPWLRLAVLSGLRGREIAALQTLIERAPAARELIVELAALATWAGQASERAALATFLRATKDSPDETRLAIAVGLARGLPPDETAKLFAEAETQQILGAATKLVSDEQADAASRLLAIELLAAAGQAPALVGLLDSSGTNPEVQLAAARAVGRHGDPALVSKALASWPKLSRQGRRELLSAALVRSALAETIAQAIEDETLAPTDLDPLERERLLAALGEPRKGEIAALLPAPAVDRQAIVAEFADATKASGDRTRGGGLFAEHCAVCHHVRGRGARVGPELSAIGSRPSATLLIDLLDPSREVSPDFMNFVVETVEGQAYSGLIASESATAITLRAGGETETPIPRDSIARLQSTGKSLMPEGFEQKLDRQAVADLLTFLRDPDPELIVEPAR